MAIALLLVGSAVIVFGLPDIPLFWHQPFSYVRQAELKPGDSDFPKLSSRFPLDKLTRYAIEREAGGSLNLQVADYRDNQGLAHRATLYLPAAISQSQRASYWDDAVKAISAHSSPQALFLTWWDNAQRIHLLTGAEAWTLLPDASAWRDRHEQQFWQEIAGGSEDNNQKLRQLARWLTMDAQLAVQEMTEQLPKQREIYWLICMDDLARLAEIESLTGIRLALETRLFPEQENLHALIAQVKQWAQAAPAQQAAGSQQQEPESNYLLQPLPGYGVRAWRVSDAKASNLLITRLLPFTGSLNRLPDGLQLVYQSEQAYLSVYRLTAATVQR